MADLLTLADKFSLNTPRQLLDQVIDEVARWPEFARSAGVPVATIKRISALQPSLK